MTATRTARELGRLKEDWAAKWPEALALWSRFTKLTEPRWCVDSADEKREGLEGSFAMIRLEDKAVVIGLEQIKKMGLEGFPLEIMGHEIGHHVYCPADLVDHGRILARMRRALPTKEHLAPFISNLYTDLLINNRLQRGSELDVAGVYRTLGRKSKDRLWTLYMRIYELLWGLKKGSLASGELTGDIEGDARLGAKLIRTYSRDWVEGAGRFASLCLMYLVDEAKEARDILKSWMDTAKAGEGGDPSGLTEVEAGEEEGAVHPADEEDGKAGKDGPEDEGEEGGYGREGGVSRKGSKKPAPERQYRSPSEYGELLGSLGLHLDSNEVAIRYYRERAMPHVVPFPVRETIESKEPLPEGLKTWEVGEPLEGIDWFESVTRSPHVIPGVTTLERTYGHTQGSLPEKIPVDLYLGVDCSGSMVNPQLNLSYPVLAGAVIVLSALRVGARVMACLSGEPGRSIATRGFISDEHEILKILTGYLGTGTTYGIPRLDEAFKDRQPEARPAHIMIVTDSDIFWMLDSKHRGRRDGWEIAKSSLDKARGGGTYVLHMGGGKSPETDRMRNDGWDVHRVASMKNLLDFAKAFSKKKYGEAK